MDAEAELLNSDPHCNYIAVLHVASIDEAVMAADEYEAFIAER